MLMMDNPDGTKPAIPLTTARDFLKVPQGASLFETKAGVHARYLGLCNDNSVFIATEAGVSRYYLKEEAVYRYDAGAPARVVMELNRLVNGEQLGTTADYHAGALYNFQVLWIEPNVNTKSGVLVTEIIEPVSAEGWFTQTPDRKQELWIAATPGLTLIDMVGISAAKTSGSVTEAAPTGPTTSLAASTTTAGKAVAFQHFEYIANNGTKQLIPNSGFLLTKVMQDGKLTVTREGRAKGEINAGAADGKTYEIVVKF